MHTLQVQRKFPLLFPEADLQSARGGDVTKRGEVPPFPSTNKMIALPEQGRGGTEGSPNLGNFLCHFLDKGLITGRISQFLQTASIVLLLLAGVIQLFGVHPTT